MKKILCKNVKLRVRRGDFVFFMHLFDLLIKMLNLNQNPLNFFGLKIWISVLKCGFDSVHKGYLHFRGRWGLQSVKNSIFMLQNLTNIWTEVKNREHGPKILRKSVKITFRGLLVWFGNRLEVNEMKMWMAKYFRIWSSDEVKSKKAPRLTSTIFLLL